MTKLAAAVGRTLADGGIRHAFGVVGGGNIMAVAGLTASGVRYVAARHEGGALSMADAYYRASGEVAVCTTSHGPGVTNVATGLAEAAKHRSGVVVVCGDAPTNGLRRNDVDQTALALSLGARVVRLTDPDTACADTAQALRIARAERCPVVLCLPADRLATEVPGTSFTAEVTREPVTAPVDIGPALDVLATAKRPLLLGGLGAWQSDAAKPIMDLADRLGALLCTTVMANGLFTSHPWSLGICGGFASPAAARLIGQADAVVAFGASLDVFTLHHGRMLSPQATLVQVDVVSTPTSERVNLGVTGDASAVAWALLDGADARGLPVSAWRSEAARRMPGAGWVDQPNPERSTADRIDPRTLSVALAELLPPERTLVLDGGHFIGWPSMYWPVADPSAMVFMGSAFQAIGLGFAGAVGAACARADRTVVVALGDGGALMGLSELDTLVRTADSAVVVVYDDASYGFEAHLYGPQGADPATVTFAQTDFAGVAEALGAQAVTVRTAADLEVFRAWRAAGSIGTFVLDCKVNPAVVAGFLEDLIAGH